MLRIVCKIRGVAVKRLNAQAMVGRQKSKPSALKLVVRELNFPAVIPAKAGIQGFFVPAPGLKTDACPESSPRQALRRCDGLSACSLSLNFGSSRE
jgi:hypothetical protein